MVVKRIVDEIKMLLLDHFRCSKLLRKGEIMSKEVKIHQDECIGCQACVEICPEVFSFDDDAGKALVNDGADPDEACVDEAIASCPVGCISKGV